jgi:DNA-binding transcriptional regulator YiaG
MKSKALRKTRSRPASTPRVGTRLVAALTELRDSLRRGEAAPPRAIVRRVRIPEAPGTYSAEKVLATRRTLRATQEQYAALLGLSVDQVRSLEQGRRKPAGSVRRLLDIINESPQRWSEMLET